MQFTVWWHLAAVILPPSKFTCEAKNRGMTDDGVTMWSGIITRENELLCSF